MSEDTTDSEITPLEVETLGHLLFGRVLRLQVALWVLAVELEQQPFNINQVAKGVGYSAWNAVANELERLRLLGMVEAFERPLPSSPHLFQRVEEAPGWHIIRAAQTALEPQGEA